MKRKITHSLLFMISILAPLQIEADINKNFDISLELARSNKIDKIIDNIIEINSLTSLYILTTGDKDVTKEKLKKYYNTKDNLWKNYKGDELKYNINTTKMTLTISNILPTNISKLQKRLFKNNPNLPENAIIDDKDLSIIIPLNSKVKSFVALIDSLDKTSINLSPTKPNDTSKPWYQPDGNGNIIIYDISSGKPKSLGKLSKNANELALTTTNKSDLDKIKAKKGAIGFVIKDGKAIKYIYDGEKWINFGGEGGIKTASICNAKTLGALRYSDEEECEQFCSYSDGKYKWKCYGTQKALETPTISQINVNKDIITIKGSGEKDSTIIIYNNNKEVKKTKITQNDFTITIKNNLSEGTHVFTAKATLDQKESQISNPFKIIIGNNKDETFTYDSSVYFVDGKDGADKIKVNGNYKDYTIKKVEENLYHLIDKNGKKAILKNLIGITFSDKEVIFGIEEIEVDDYLYYYL